MRQISSTARQSLVDFSSDEQEMALVRISHPDLTEPKLLCTHRTEWISLDPLIGGTKSRWLQLGFEPAAFQAVVMDVLVPDDRDNTLAEARIVLNDVDEEIANFVRTPPQPTWNSVLPTLDIAVTLVSEPDTPPAFWLGLELVDASGQSGSLSLTFKRTQMEDEPWPADVISRSQNRGVVK